MKVLVSTDSSCLINTDVLKKNGISVFPLNVIIDGNEYLDGITINQDSLCKAMRENKSIKTSTPPIGKVVEYFENLLNQGYDKIIHFTISSKLSSMYQLFLNVSQTYFEGKIIIIDSYSVSSLMLSHIILVNEEVKKGTDFDNIIKLVEERKQDNYVFFIPENLIALKNGGRISPTIAVIGNTLGLKPIIILKNGELVKDSMTRNIKRAFFERLDRIKNDYPAEKYDISIVDFDANEQVVMAIKDFVVNNLNYKDVIRGIIPVNVCAHCGPGTIGVIISPKILNKSLKNYL